MDESHEAAIALAGFGRALKIPKTGSAAAAAATDNNDGGDEHGPYAHFPLLFALVTRALSLTRHEAAYLYLLNHAKSVVSAAVRASVVGPYAAQGLLGGRWVRGEIERVMEENWGVEVEDCGQGVVGLDLWGGRHEVLYSRIFCS